MTLEELIEEVVTNGYTVEISHEDGDPAAFRRGRIRVQVLTRANIVADEIVVDLDDEDREAHGWLENFLCRFW